MAKFSETFLQGLLTPTYSEALRNAATGAVMTPAVISQEQERKRREKGMMGGMLAAQQAAAEGRFDSETMQSYIGSMQGLGVPTADIMTTLPNLQAANKEAIQQNRTNNFVKSLGEDYVALYSAGVPLKDVRSQYLKDSQQRAFSSLISNLDIDIDPALAQEMTAKELFQIMEDQKEKANTNQANQEWAAWVQNNPTISDANRTEGLQAAAKVFGADAPAKLAELESKYLANEATRQGNTVVKAVVTLNSDAMFTDIPGFQNKSNLKSVDLAIDNNGNLTPESIKFLEANATTAFVPSINKSWTNSNLNNNNNNNNNNNEGSSGQGDAQVTLGQLSPALITGLVDNQFKEQP